MREGLDLVHAVRDEEDQPAAGDEGADRLEQDVAVGDVEGGGDLVQDEDARLADQGSGQHDELLLGERQVAATAAEIDRGAGQARQGRLGDRAPLGHRQAPPPQPVIAQEDVVQHRSLRCQQHLLEHGGDAVRPGHGRARQPHRLAVDRDAASIRLDDAGQELDQRALAAAVLAQDGVDLAGRERDVDSVQRHRLAVPLARCR